MNYKIFSQYNKIKFYIIVLKSHGKKDKKYLVFYLLFNLITGEIELKRLLNRKIFLIIIKSCNNKLEEENLG